MNTSGDTHVCADYAEPLEDDHGNPREVQAA